MTTKEAMEIMAHQNGEIVLIETPEGIRKRIFCDGELYEPNPLYDFMVKIINKGREENEEMKSLLSELLDNGLVFTSCIELNTGFDGEVWEETARKVISNSLGEI